MPQARRLVLTILDRAAPQAYADVEKPLGFLNLDDWLVALIKPRMWRKYPQWVEAIEQRLSDPDWLSGLRPAAWN